MMTTRALRALPLAALLALATTEPAGRLLAQATEPAVSAVFAQGRIQPASRIVRLAPFGSGSGAPVAKLLVEEGAEVPAGATLAEMANLPLELARATEAAAEQNAAELALKLARLALERAELDAETARAEAAANLAVARSGAGRRHVSAARLNELRTALTSRANALERLRRSRAAHLAPHAAAVEVARKSAEPQSGAARRVADAELTRAEAALALAAREFDMSLLAEDDAVATLRAGLVHAEEQHALPLVTEEELALASLRFQKLDTQLAATRRVLETEILLAAERVRSAAARTGNARLAAEQALVKAPFAGKVLRIATRPGETVGPAGLVEFADTKKLLVVAEVSAADLPRVALGDRAAIRVPGLSGELAGKVVRISPLIGANDLVDDNPTVSKDLRVAAVEIEPENAAALANLLRARVSVRIAR